MSYVERYLDFLLTSSFRHTIQINIFETTIHFILVHIQCNDVSSCQLIEILHHWINASLQENCEWILIWNYHTTCWRLAWTLQRLRKTVHQEFLSCFIIIIIIIIYLIILWITLHLYVQCTVNICIYIYIYIYIYIIYIFHQENNDCEYPYI